MATKEDPNYLERGKSEGALGKQHPGKVGEVSREQEKAIEEVDEHAATKKPDADPDQPGGYPGPESE